jgi:hypothetical protein
MEAHAGALKSITHLHLEHDIVMEFIVMDNDSSSKNILQWDYNKAVRAGLMMSFP